MTSTAATVATFDICGDLPIGTTLLEASAGTGKTFTIAALATRYVAEGIAELGELMLVTFGRAATQELRERVRERLVSMQRALRDPGTARASADMLEASLAGVSDDEVAVRRARLTRALADFDAATIATTHGFCQQMLTGLGVAGDLEPDATFAESVDDLVVEVVDDLYLRKFGRPDSPRAPVLTYADALSTVRRAVYDPQAVLAPDDAEAGTLAALRFGIARRARQEVALRKRQRRLLDYDDLVVRLRDALVDNPAAQQRVRSRYRVVMVDEFQDTDPAQWEILRLAFHGHTTLVLIGDPKQAIYAFRGGDVDAYLAAAEVATARATLGRNWRSDAALLDALNAVFGGAALGQEQIVVRPVDSAHPHRRLAGTPSDAPLRLRVVRRTQLNQGRGKLPRVDPARELVAADVAADVVRLLEAGAMLHTLGPPRAVTAGDVAVLVRTNAQALLVRDAFRQVAVPAVLTGAVNVFTTDMAIEWLVLLQALEQPHRAVRVRTAAIGRFVGWSAERLAQAGDDAMDELGPLLRSWADVLATRGVPALLEVITELGLPERLLRTVDGERQLTDLRHLAQSLHAASVAENLGVAAQVEWLQRRIADAGDDPTEERSRRLESDAAAVQIVTVHRSKGLEFPVVYAPFAWDTYKGNPEFLRLHLDGARILDVSGKEGPSYDEHRRLHDAEEAGEDLRLLYVALTRAQCQVVTWWAPTTTTAASPLQRLLMGSFAPGLQPPATVNVPSDDAAAAAFAQLAERARGAVSVEPVHDDRTRRWTPTHPAIPDLNAAPFDRALDAAWRRTSYTGLTSAAYHEGPGVSSEPEERQLDDESDTTPHVDADLLAEPLRAVISPMAGLPAGTAFGIAVHSVLEAVDTGAPDILEELTGRCREVLDARLTRAMDPVELATGLLPSLLTPLGPLMAQRRLIDVLPADRLAELDFELPLAGGDRAGAPAARLRSVAELLRRRLPPGDPFAGYPDRLEELFDQQLSGYLVGSLDTVLRVRGSNGVPGYVIADYKTNWLGGVSAETLSAWHYRPQALTEAMLVGHYPLQALLYCVALHRYLRWRQPGYDPDRHLRGVLYLFVRGMCGPDTPRVDSIPCGVFGWQPPSGLIDELSTLLAGSGDDA